MFSSSASSTSSSEEFLSESLTTSSLKSIQSSISDPCLPKRVEKCLTVDLTDIFYGSTRVAEVEWKDYTETFYVPIHKGCTLGTKLEYKRPNKPVQFTICDDFECDSCDGVFRRKNDIFMKYRIKLADALCGFKLKVKTVDGRVMTFRINDVVHPNYVKVIPKEGLPGTGGSDERGDLHLIFELIFPKRLSLCNKHAISNALETAELLT